MWNTKVSDLKHKSCSSTFCTDPLLKHFCPLLVFESLYKGRRMHLLQLFTFCHSRSKMKRKSIMLKMIVIFILVLNTAYVTSFHREDRNFGSNMPFGDIEFQGIIYHVLSINVLNLTQSSPSKIEE